MSTTLRLRLRSLAVAAMLEVRDPRVLFVCLYIVVCCVHLLVLDQGVRSGDSNVTMDQREISM